MSISFITGPAHAGKTTYIYKKTAADAKRNPDKNYFVIVPEQYTLSTQKKLTRYSDGAILNIDVLSFARLTHRIFEELGLGTESVLEDTGKNLLLRKVINECAGDLKVLTGEIKRMGYVDEIKSLLTELDQYRIDAEELEEMAANADTALLSAKLLDMALLKRAFKEKCADKYITSEQILEKLADVAAESKKLSDAVFVFDGFTGFTPVQMYFLEHLFPVADEIYFTLTIDDTRDLRGIKIHDIPENDLFYITKKCYVSLRNLAVRKGQKVNEDIVVREEDVLANTAKDIRFLGDTIYRPMKNVYAGEPENIHVNRFQTMAEELNFVASEIKRLVRTGGYRYRDFAVICGDNAYFALSRRIFSQVEVPVFIDEKTSSAAVPIVAFVKNIFKVSEKNFAVEAVMDLVRTSLTGLSFDECDRLENYLYAKGIKSRWKWERSWEDEEMNELRKRLNSALGKLPGKTSGKKENTETLTAGKITESLYEVIEELGVSDKIYECVEKYEAEGNLAKSTEYEKCYKAVMDILEKIYEFLGDEEMSLAEYTEILSAGLDKLKLGVIPLGSDYVTVGDIERSRLSDVRVLFITGVAEGSIPGKTSSGGILSQIERQSINEKTADSGSGGREHLVTDRERALSGRFYIMDAVCKPTDALYFSYAGIDSDGKSLRRSYLLDLIERRFEGLKEKTVVDEFARIESAKTCKKYVYEGLSDIDDPAKSKEWQGALSAYLELPGVRESLKKDLERIFKENSSDSLGKELAEKLYGKVLYGSVSNLERFAGCAYSYFLRYGLKLEDRDVLEFDTIKLGVLLHNAVDEFWKRIADDGRKWQDITEEEAEKLGESVFSELEEQYAEQGYFESEGDKFRLSMIRDLYFHTIDILGFHLKQGSFEVAETEYAFDSYMDLTEGSMHFKGSADRIDTYEKGDDVYVKVLDLKSYDNSLSLDNVYYGLQLQLLVYLHEAMEKESKKRGKKARFGGVFYYEMKDPVVDAPESDNPEEDAAKIDRDIKKEQKLSGIHTDDQDVIRAIDKDFGNDGLVLKGSTKKDGGYNQYTKAFSDEDYNAVDSFVMQKLKSLGDKIAKGYMAKNPYHKGQSSSCEHCDYRGICDFDRDDGDEFRWLNSLKDPEALEAIKRANDKK